MADSYGEKKHPPTLRRRQQARAAGRVVRSYDLAAALLLLGGLCAWFWLGRDVVDYIGQLTRNRLGGRVCLTADADVAIQWWQATMSGTGRVLLPVLGLLFVIAVASHLGQFGWLFLPGKLALDFHRVDPFQGFGRLFSAGSLTRWLFGLLKTATVLTVAGWSLWSERQQLLQLGALDVGPLAALMGELLLGTGLKIALALLALGVLDYGYQRWRLERDLRMTTQELREELTGWQGGPQISQRRRQLRQQLQEDEICLPGDFSPLPYRPIKQ